MKRHQFIQLIERRPLLQVAFDFSDLGEAVSKAVEVVRGGLDIAEVGTPLIKSFGIYAIKVFRTIFRDKFVAADLKCVDAAELELVPALREGADIVTIMGFATDDFVQMAQDIVKKYDGILMVDLMYVPNPLERAKRLNELGVDVVLLHVGVDVQKLRKTTAKALLNEIKELSSSGLKIAVAGGIKPEEVEIYAEAGAKIIIIGSAITRSADPRRAAEEAYRRLAK